LSEQKRRIAVVGVGNILMGDEGIGVRVVEELCRKDLPERVELFDGGTAFHALAAQLESFDKLIVVDAVKGGKPPGTLYRFEAGELAETRRTMLSLHDLGVVETLLIEQVLHRMPEEIVLIGAEPEAIELSMELSPCLQDKLPGLIEMVLKEIKD